MKKRLLSALLALALVFVLLPTTALADTTPVTDENVKINGTAVIVGNDISLGEGNGTYSYDKATHTLTLNSATITTTGNIGISFGVPVKGNIDYKIELIGTNTISSTSAQAIYVEYDSDLDQQGTQKLSTLTINGSAGSQLILNASGYEKEAIWSKGDFTLSGGTAVTAFSSGEIAVNVGSMTINNSKLSAQSSSYGTTVVLYGFEMIGDAAEFEALNTSSGVRAVLRTSGASENIDWSKYQLITGSYSGNALTKSEPTVCDKNTLNELFSSSSTTRYIHIAKRTIPALQRTSDVLIAGENAVVGQCTNIPAATGTGSYSYDADKKELTLKDVNITSGINAIQFMANGAYTIKLEGENKISNVSNGISLSDDQYITSLNVTITGTGSLDISAKGLAINMKKGDLKFENTGAIKLATGNIGLNNNALSVKGNITITDMSKYSVTGTQQTGGKPLGSEVSLTEASQLKGGTTGYRIITITPAALEESNVYVAGTNLYKNTAYTIQNGKPVMGGTYPGNYNIYFDATDYVLHVKNADIDATGKTGISGTSNIVFEGTNSITASTYGIYSDFKSSNLNISGSGFLTVETYAGNSAIATAYTSMSIIISGQGFTVTADTSRTNVSAIYSDKGGLTIKDGATVKAISANNSRAIRIGGSLTVTDATLTATSTSDRKPTIEVEGGATLAGSTVTITNNSTTQGKQYEDSNAASSALHVNGAVTISGGTVTAEAKAGGNAIRAVGNITVSNDATVTAKNNSQYFNAITAGRATGGEVNTLYNLIVSGENTRITATNAHDNKLAYGGAINAYIKNANEGHYLKVGTDTKAIAPNVKTTVKNNSLTITRGDAYTTPQVAANYTIAGQTMYVGKYYKTDVNGNITDGTAQDYNIFCDSANDFTLNNATISSTGTGGSTGVIMTNLNYSSAQFHIKLIGTNSINNAGHHAILGEGAYSTIIIENAENASNTSLTISGNFLPVYSFGNVTINAEVVIINTNGNLISTNKDGHANGAFDLGSGYKCYASTSTTGNPLEEFNSANYGAYKYLRVTTQTPETGGGSTHQHVWDEAWHDTGDYHHAHQCTICKAYDTTTQEPHNVTGHRDNHDGSHSNICGSCGYSAKVSHSYTWAPNANDNEKHIGTCVCGNVVEKYHNFVGDVCSDCGYNKSTGTTCEHVWTTEWTIDTVDNEYHWHKCIKCNAITDKKPHAYTIVTDSGTNHIRECECKVFYVEDHISSDWIIDTPATATTAGSMHKECTVCKHKMQTEVIPATGEIVPPTPDNPGTIVIIRPAEEEKPAQQPNPSTGANDLVGLAVAAAVAAALGSAALLRKHD